jgi:hypothetical protein
MSTRDAARLDLLSGTAEDWIAARSLRDRMVHEYQRDPAALADALNAAHETIPLLAGFARACRDYITARGLL